MKDLIKYQIWDWLSLSPKKKNTDAKNENPNHSTTLRILLWCSLLSDWYLYPPCFACPCKNNFLNTEKLHLPSFAQVKHDNLMLCLTDSWCTTMFRWFSTGVDKMILSTPFACTPNACIWCCEHSRGGVSQLDISEETFNKKHLQRLLQIHFLGRWFPNKIKIQTISKATPVF